MDNQVPNQSDDDWPLPQFNFRVCWDNAEMRFQEVSGPSIETPAIEYRHDDRVAFSTGKTPCVQKYSNVTLRRGVVTNDFKFEDWLEPTKTKSLKRVPVTILLVDPTGKPMAAWILRQAWPVKITCADARSDGHTATIDTLEFAHEGFTIESL